MRHVLLFLPRLACAVTCVAIILTATPILLLLGHDRDGDRP